jgi:hypothetical protein
MRPGDRQRVASRWAGPCAGALAAVCPLVAAHAAPLDNAVQRLSDVAFVNGHAPADGGAMLMRSDISAPLGFSSPFMTGAPDLTAAMIRPLQVQAGGGLRLGGQVPVQTVGAFLQGKLQAMGVEDGAAEFGGAGRFYLFAAVHGQAVGYNLQTQGGVHRAGWSTDETSAMVGDGQVGLGWRKDDMEAALGYIHRGVHFRNVPVGISDGFADDMAAVSFTLHMH